MVEAVKRNLGLGLVALDVRACAVVDSDLRSITPMWIGRLLGPVVRVSGKDVPMPYAANLEKLALIKVADVIEAAKKVCYR